MKDFISKVQESKKNTKENVDKEDPYFDDNDTTSPSDSLFQIQDEKDTRKNN